MAHRGPRSVLAAAAPLVLAALASCTRSTEDWLADLEHPEPYTRLLAVAALAHADPSDWPRTVPALARMTLDSGADVRHRAVRSLGELGNGCAAILVDLAVGEDTDRETRAGAMRGLGAVPAAAVSRLAVILEQGRGPSVLYAMSALGNLGSAARPLIPALVERIHDDAPELREKARSVLLAVTLDVACTEVDGAIEDARSAILAYGKDAIAPLIERLEASFDPCVVRLLAAFEQEALDALFAAKPPEDPANADFLRRALDGFGDAPAPFLAEKVLNDKNRRISSLAIAWMSRHADAALPALLPYLEDPDSRIRTRAVAALGRLGRPARDAIPQVRSLLEDPEPKVRKAARAFLDSIN
jgi:HEAT repeat protein